MGWDRARADELGPRVPWVHRLDRSGHLVQVDVARAVMVERVEHLRARARAHGGMSARTLARRDRARAAQHARSPRDESTMHCVGSDCAVDVHTHLLDLILGGLLVLVAGHRVAKPL